MKGQKARRRKAVVTIKIQCHKCHKELTAFVLKQWYNPARPIKPVDPSDPLFYVCKNKSQKALTDQTYKNPLPISLMCRQSSFL